MNSLVNLIHFIEIFNIKKTNYYHVIVCREKSQYAKIEMTFAVKY